MNEGNERNGAVDKMREMVLWMEGMGGMGGVVL